jgi:hypothetical protein
MTESRMSGVNMYKAWTKQEIQTKRVTKSHEYRQNGRKRIILKSVRDKKV